MRIIVTAGPTREYIDTVRFITNASSGKMGCAVAGAAVRAGHDVMLILAEGIRAAEGCEVARFVGVGELANTLSENFGACDALVMAAAVGDFRPEETSDAKLSRDAGPITIRLIPVEDVLAGVGKRKRAGQTIVAFAVQDAASSELEAQARAKMARKGADYIVVNTPQAMAAEDSHACILSPRGVVLPWASRAKRELAEEIVKLLR